MKKILYINQYFRHPKEPGITRSYWIARELIKAGYDVTMLAHRNALLDFVENPPPVEKTTIDDIRVIYVRNEYDNSMGVIARSWSFLKFMFKSTYYAFREKNVDLVIATSTPLTVAFPALMRKWFKKTPFIFEVRDLWPDVPIEMGAVKNKLLVRFLKWFEKTTYKNAIHVVALSPGMQEGVIKHIPKEKTTMIPNMAKIDKFWPRSKNQEIVKEFGLKPNSFKIIHFGAMGMVNGLENFVKAAIMLKERKVDDVEFILAGHGRMKKEYEKIWKENNLENLTIIGRLPMEKISELVNVCDISYVGVSTYKILEINSANKFFDSLSAGKPILINFNGWMKEIIEKEKCGIKVFSTDHNELIDKILLLKNDTNLRKELGQNARKLAEQKYDKSILCKQFVDLVNQVFPEK